MTDKPILRRLQTSSEHMEHLVTIYVNDVPLRVPHAMNLAAALMLSGTRQFSSNPASATPRAPYCMMGVCFECLIDVDGKSNTQSCLTRVREGMRVRTMTHTDLTTVVDHITVLATP